MDDVPSLHNTETRKQLRAFKLTAQHTYWHMCVSRFTTSVMLIHLKVMLNYIINLPNNSSVNGVIAFGQR